MSSFDQKMAARMKLAMILFVLLIIFIAEAKKALDPYKVMLLLFFSVIFLRFAPIFVFGY